MTMKFLLAVFLFSVVFANAQDTVEVPDDWQPVQLGVKGNGGRKFLSGGDKLVLFKSYEHWWGNEEDVLNSMGVVYDRLPVSSLSDSAWVSGGYKVALIASNDGGDTDVTSQEVSPEAQKNMYDFVSKGGYLIVNMGDNDASGSFIAPGPSNTSVGNPRYTFYNNVPCTNFGNVTKQGSETSIFDGVDITSSQVCWTNHGNLVDAQYELPRSAKVFWTQTFDDGEKPIMAEYGVGCGKVLVHTVTLEFWIAYAGNNSILFNNVIQYAFKSHHDENDNCIKQDDIDCGSPLNKTDSIQFYSKYTPRSYTASVKGRLDVTPLVIGVSLCEKCDNTVPKKQTSYNCQATVNGSTITISKTTPGAYVSWKVEVQGVTKYCGVCMTKIGSTKKVCGTVAEWYPNTHPICPDNV